MYTLISSAIILFIHSASAVNDTESFPVAPQTPVTPIAPIEVTESPYTTDFVDPRCMEDVPPPNVEHTCLGIWRYKFCGAEWMKGYCCGTCGYESCLNICYDNDVNNIPSEYYPSPFDCKSDESPGTKHKCPEIQESGKCDEEWVWGYCCDSCPESCKCPEHEHEHKHHHHHHHDDKEDVIKSDIDKIPGLDVDNMPDFNIGDIPGLDDDDEGEIDDDYSITFNVVPWTLANLWGICLVVLCGNLCLCHWCIKHDPFGICCYCK